jgi:pimeloyl-ACP methyl ester carboxylesterase
LTQCKAEQAIIGLAGRYQSRRARDRTPKQFHYAFTNTLSEEESAAVYERYHILAPGRFVWGGGLANFTPGYQDTYVNFKNDDRAPLLFIAGGDDNIMPPSVNESNAHHYRRSKAITDYYEFPGRSHYTLGQHGWRKLPTTRSTGQPSTRRATSR